jgi:hypothetical protein
LINPIFFNFFNVFFLKEIQNSMLRNNYELINAGKIDQLKTGIGNLFVENLYKLFNTKLERGEEHLILFLSEIYLENSAIRKSEKYSDLIEILRVALINQNLVLFRELLIVFITLKARIEDSLSQYNLLLLAAEYDKTGVFFDILNQYNLAQFFGSNSDSLFSESFKISSLRNNFTFLKKLFTKFTDENNFYMKKWITDDLIKTSAQNIECFKVVYIIDEGKECFGEDILKHCLEKEYKETFLWMLDQFQSLHKIKNRIKTNREKIEYEMLLRNIKVDTPQSIYNILMQKCKKNENDFLNKTGKYLLEKMFELECFVSEN